jgi:hypothetical protein|tara:strand:- start:4484 stop:4771 length:288 start_codon:yes stop_codon:yes gene_type:complete
MAKLNDFKDMVNGIDDTELLKEGQGLLRDIIEIQSLKYKIRNLEEGLIDNGRAAFYLFATELDQDEIAYAAERITGRLKVLEKRNKKSKDTNEND